jgi:hypothetical protein
VDIRPIREEELAILLHVEVDPRPRLPEHVGADQVRNDPEEPDDCAQLLALTAKVTA